MQLKKIVSHKWIGVALVGTVLMVQPLWAKDYEGHWAKEAIQKWSTYEVVKGMENGDFKPNASVTRAELATFINRTFQFASGEALRTYEDVKEDAWYEEAVTRVTSRGLMYIPGTKFEPSKAATREEVAYALAKAYDVKANMAEPVAFEDASEISPWAAQSVQALVQAGYIKGHPDGNFKPHDPITRAEVVTLLENLTKRWN